MTHSLAAAFHVYQTRAVYVALPILALLAFIVAAVVVGAVYAGGGMTRATYVGAMVALAILFVLVLLATAGLALYLRVTRGVAF